MRVLVPTVPPVLPLPQGPAVSERPAQSIPSSTALEAVVLGLPEVPALPTLAPPLLASAVLHLVASRVLAPWVERSFPTVPALVLAPPPQMELVAAPPQEFVEIFPRPPATWLVVTFSRRTPTALSPVVLLPAVRAALAAFALTTVLPFNALETGLAMVLSARLASVLHSP